MVIASSISFHCSHRAIYTLYYSRISLYYMYDNIIAAIVRIENRVGILFYFEQQQQPKMRQRP